MYINIYVFFFMRKWEDEFGGGVGGDSLHGSIQAENIKKNTYIFIYI